MIRRGRAEGWLIRPVSALPAWAKLCGASFNNVRVGQLDGLEDRGSTVIAEKSISSDNMGPLMVVPRRIILSRERVDEQSKTDVDLKELLESLGDFGKVNKQPASHLRTVRLLHYLPNGITAG